MADGGICLVLQGVLEQVTTATVNLVNADLLAKNRGLTVTETTRPSSGRCAEECQGKTASNQKGIASKDLRID